MVNEQTTFRKMIANYTQKYGQFCWNGVVNPELLDEEFYNDYGSEKEGWDSFCYITEDGYCVFITEYDGAHSVDSRYIGEERGCK
jgi:hypothetical protein